MDWLSWMLTGTVVFYAVALTVKTGLPLLRYDKAKSRVVEVGGTIVSCYGEEVTKRNREVVRSFYPVYQCEIDGRMVSLSGLVRRIGSSASAVGEKVTLLYDERTGELWCKSDLPLMVKQIKVRLMVVAGVVAVAVLTSTMQ